MARYQEIGERSRRQKPQAARFLPASDVDSLPQRLLGGRALALSRAGRPQHGEHQGVAPVLTCGVRRRQGALDHLEGVIALARLRRRFGEQTQIQRQIDAVALTLKGFQRRSKRGEAGRGVLSKAGRPRQMHLADADVEIHFARAADGDQFLGGPLGRLCRGEDRLNDEPLHKDVGEARRRFKPPRPLHGLLEEPFPLFKIAERNRRHRQHRLRRGDRVEP